MPNRTEFVARLMIYDADSGKLLGSVEPQRNVYDKTPDKPTSEVGLRMRPTEDVYVVLNGWDNGGNQATFTIFVNPLTMWIWIGGIVLVLGTLFAIWPHPARRRERVPSMALWGWSEGVIMNDVLLWVTLLVAVLVSAGAVLWALWPVLQTGARRNWCRTMTV